MSNIGEELKNDSEEGTPQGGEFREEAEDDNLEGINNKQVIL